MFKKCAFVSLVLALVLSLSGCGGSAAKYAAQDSFDGYANGMMSEVSSVGFASDAGAAYDAVGYETSNAADRDRSSGQKWVTTLRYGAETRDYDASTAWIRERVDAVGGYVESENEYSYNSEARSCDLVIRVPASELDAFLDGFEENLHLVRRSQDREDVTLEYVDTETWRDVLRSEQSRLMSLMETAESLSDVLAIEDRLAEVKTDLERAESRLRVYDNKVDYATMYLNVSEVKRFSHVPVNVGEEVSEGILANAVWVVDTAVGAVLWVVTHLPAILALAVVVFAGSRVHACVARYCAKHKVRNPLAAWGAERWRRREERRSVRLRK